LGKLAEDRYASVRVRVAENTSTPAEVLTRLTADDDREVRRQAVEYASAPPELLRLAADDDKDVRWQVAENANAVSWAGRLALSLRSPTIKSEYAQRIKYA